jgi:hypothetical protein
VKHVLRYLGDHALAAIALVCSLLALAGSSYAAFTISGGQIVNHTIDPVKFNPRLIGGNVRAWARMSASGRVIAGRVFKGGLLGGNEYNVEWNIAHVGRCGTLVSVDADNPGVSPVDVSLPGGGAEVAGYATARTSDFPKGNPSRGKHSTTSVTTFNQQGQPTPLGFDVILVC